MLKLPLIVLGFALALVAPASLPAAAQTQAPAPQPGAGLVGLPVYSSDGQHLGEVISLVTSGGQVAVRAEMGAFLGLGPNPVPILIDGDVFHKKIDRIELKLTAGEVRDKLAQQNVGPKQ